MSRPDDADLDRRLAEAGQRWQADFRPPAFGPMLARATVTAPARSNRGHHRRWATPFLIAAAALGIPLLSIQIIHGLQYERVVPAAPNAAAYPPPAGSSLLRPDQTGAPWRDATIAANDVDLTVHLPAGCATAPPGQRFQAVLAGDNPTSITVAVLPVCTYLRAGSATAPSPDVAVSLRLSQPLRHRALISRADAMIHPVLPESSISRPGHLPAGYRLVGLDWDETGYGLTVQTFTGTDPAQTLLVEQSPQTPLSEPAGPMQTVIGPTTIHDRPAQVIGTRDNDAQLCVRWGTDQQFNEVCGYRSGHNTIPLTELKKVATSVRSP